MFASCPNCSKAMKTANGYAFHVAWCKAPAAPVEPIAEPMHPVLAHVLRGEPLPAEYTIVEPAPEPPAPRKVAAPKAPAAKAAKLPAVGTGKHAKCVHHEPVTRTRAGVAYQCFADMPDHEAIAMRAAFVAELDAIADAHHAAWIARPTGDGLAIVGLEDTSKRGRWPYWTGDAHGRPDFQPKHVRELVPLAA